MLHSLVTLSIAIGSSHLWSPAPWMTPPSGATSARRAGLGPEVLAAAGVSPAQVGILLAAMGEGLPAQVSAALVQTDTAVERVGSLRAQLHQDPMNAELRLQLRQARAAAIVARQALASTQQSWGSAAVAVVPGLAQRVLQVRSSRGHNTAPEFWAVPRTEAQWRRLEQDLLIERRCTRMNRAVPTEVAERLSQTRTHPDVVAARQALAANLEPIRAAFGQ